MALETLTKTNNTNLVQVYTNYLGQAVVVSPGETKQFQVLSSTDPGSSGGTPGADGADGADGAAGADGASAQSFDGESVDFFEDYSAGAISSLTGGSGWGGDGRVVNGVISSRTTHNSIAQKRLTITGDGQFGRKLPYAGKWNWIRIGILARIVAAGTSTFSGRWAIGASAGTAAMYGDSNPTNWIGTAQYDTGSSDDWTYNSGTSTPVYLSSTYESVWRVGASDTAVTGSFTGGRPGFPVTEAYLASVFVDIVRPLFTGNTALTYSQKIYGSATNAAIQYHVSRDEFMVALRFTTPNSLNSTIWTAQGDPSDKASVTETAGAFDCINFWWENADNPIDIAAIAVRKLA